MSHYLDIKAMIIKSGFTMKEIVARLHEKYYWSDSAGNFSNKLKRESLRYREAVELADVLGYDIVWVKREENEQA